ncbi:MULTISPECIES: GNAT family N-acetyltransferase [unclassified Acinetobacter]|uniref:GNAT family N-acetyltransferase n=1 Tax=unclassified Acinetobacter TaxID=196816 RepID=UPI001ED9C87C|nr:GNAT family N-acetyltransferase [Acinetobacter sp. SM34]MCG2609727.1 GNAT family N-acetyltransferase [Acinetobacter sp. SM34]
MQFQHDDNGQQGEFFQLNAAGERVAEISYLWRGEHQIIAHHTWVDDSLRGQGTARQLLDVLVEFARKNQLKIVPTCSYVDVMFKRDQSLTDVAA